MSIAEGTRVTEDYQVTEFDIATAQADADAAESLSTIHWDRCRTKDVVGVDCLRCRQLQDIEFDLHTAWEALVILKAQQAAGRQTVAR